MASEDRCVCCGEIIPEGTHVCWKCQNAGKGKKMRKPERIKQELEESWKYRHVYEDEIGTVCVLPVDIVEDCIKLIDGYFSGDNLTPTRVLGKSVIMYHIPEGHGRFWFRVEGENSAMVFGACDRKIEVGENPEAVKDKKDTVPVFGVVCQSPAKARAIATAFNKLADEMVLQELAREKPELIDRDRLLSYMSDNWLAHTPTDNDSPEEKERKEIYCQGLQDAWHMVKDFPAIRPD